MTFIKKKVENTLTNYLPKKVKRLIFISSVIGLIKNIKDPDIEILNKINELFNLSTDNKVLKLPIYFKYYIWTSFKRGVDESVIKNINNSDIEISNVNIFIKKILNDIPSWLNYGTNELIISDLKKIIAHRVYFA